MMDWKKRCLNRVKRLFGRGDPPPHFDGPPIQIPQVKISHSQARGAEATFELESEEEPMTATAEGMVVDPVTLRQRMLNHLEMEQLRRICADLGIDFASLSGGKGRKVMAVVQHAKEEDKLDALVAACARHSDDPDLFSFQRK